MPTLAEGIAAARIHPYAVGTHGSSPLDAPEPAAVSCHDRYEKGEPLEDPKKLSAASYGYTGRMGDAEHDHLISVQLGGDPSDYRNLWVEPADPGHKKGSGVNNKKDPVENKLHTAVCAGKITLAQAQQAIVTDWTVSAQGQAGRHG